MRRGPNYTPYIVVSLLVHLGAGLLLATGVLTKMDWRTLPPLDEPATMTLVQEDSVVPPTPTFFPTIESQRVAQPPPNTNLESERDTALRSQEQGAEANSPLPQQTGQERASVAYQDSPQLTPRQTNPSEAQSASKPTEPTPATAPQPTKPTPPEQNQTKPEKPETTKPRSTLEDGLTLKPSEAQPRKPPQTQPRPEAPPKQSKQPDQAAQPAQPPPSPASAYLQKKQMSGGRAAAVGASSPATRETELGRYKSKMYRAIGSLWYLKVEQQMTTLGIGTVKIRFYVRANGVLQSVAVSTQSGRTEFLETISKQSIIESGPFEPFSDSLKLQLGDGYWEDITFSIY